ncbi:hypothetical protein AMTRI_Chr12g238530 [Amborella trichopoda]
MELALKNLIKFTTSDINHKKPVESEKIEPETHHLRISQTEMTNIHMMGHAHTRGGQYANALIPRSYFSTTPPPPQLPPQHQQLPLPHHTIIAPPQAYPLPSLLPPCNTTTQLPTHHHLHCFPATT